MAKVNIDGQYFYNYSTEEPASKKSVIKSWITGDSE